MRRVAFAAAVIAVGLVAHSSGGSCGGRSSNSSGSGRRPARVEEPCRIRTSRKSRDSCSQNYYKFLGELWDVSGLPLSWGTDAVTDFLAGWKVIPVKTFRHGYRRKKIGRDAVFRQTWAAVVAAPAPQKSS